MRLRLGERASSAGRGDFERGVVGAELLHTTTDEDANLTRGETTEADFGDLSTGAEECCISWSSAECTDKSRRGTLFCGDFIKGDAGFSGMDSCAGDDSLLPRALPVHAVCSGLSDQREESVFFRVMVEVLMWVFVR